jgi:hypothetical protein
VVGKLFATPSYHYRPFLTSILVILKPGPSFQFHETSLLVANSVSCARFGKMANKGQKKKKIRFLKGKKIDKKKE